MSVKNFPKRVKVHPQNPQMRWINFAAELLKNGGVVAYPTDTRYGVGCDILQKKAIERIYRIKKHDVHHPLSFIFPDLKRLSEYVNISTPNYKILRRCLPGPFTFILEATRLIPKIMLTNRKTVGVRIPEDPIINALTTSLEGPILNSSVSGNPMFEMNDPEVIEDEIGHQIDFILDGGIIISEPSTVVDLTGGEPVVIREGKGDISLLS
ncbi:threonylcarbamoyl-AMP synthase [bacterium]|nr:threonylcarbamoyl-AMP synthase [FCB group bacterium]MBL7192308.1 threonylcarbamoyl-AMP synthase [bacterium]